MSEEVLHEKLNGLEKLIDTKLESVCKEIGGLHDTLKEHNGRLTRTEKVLEQMKGAGKVVSGFWGLIGGVVVAIFAFLLNRHL